MPRQIRNFVGAGLCILALLAHTVTARADELPHVTSGHIERLAAFPSRYVSARDIDVWLPDGYGPGKRYAVLYMMDGQMLFDPAITWNKQAWGADRTLASLLASGQVRDTIIVGVANNPALRHAEFFPQKAVPILPPSVREPFVHETLHAKPLADRYLRFLVTELKPAIDARFLTLPDRDNTFIMGSSMGGIISLYALSEYPAVFGGAACLSTHWIGTFKVNAAIPLAEFIYFQSHLPDPATHRIYMDRGTQDLDALYADAQPFADDLVRERGYTDANFMSRVIEGAGHHENDWSARLDGPLRFLLRTP
jgi:enterochelin esterase-like enzyme